MYVGKRSKRLRFQFGLTMTHVDAEVVAAELGAAVRKYPPGSDRHASLQRLYRRLMLSLETAEQRRAAFEARRAALGS
jgi:hypothetical protein